MEGCSKELNNVPDGDERDLSSYSKNEYNDNGSETINTCDRICSNVENRPGDEKNGVPESLDVCKTLDKNDTDFIKPELDLIKPLKTTTQERSAVQTVHSEHSIASDKNASEILKIQKGPAQRMAEQNVPVPYKEPVWSRLLASKYFFEVIKNGVILGQIALNKPYLVVGRLSNCDIVLEHPSISRYQCIIQQGEGGEDKAPGVYAYDLDSTHGTFQNKHRLQPGKYNRLHVGHMIKFGGSTRMFILQGPDIDQEPETKESVTELLALAKERKIKLAKLESGESEEEEKLEPKSTQEPKERQIDAADDGIDWGMGEDAQEEDDDDSDDDDSASGTSQMNPFAMNEELYLNDPKKTLRGWFEREGFDLPEYKTEELKPGVFRCSVEIPAQGKGSGPLVCSIEHKGKKKDTVIQCALEACRKLDKQGLLRQAKHDSHEKKRKNWSENDYYDSDEDEFLDRTGDIERKRKYRQKEIEATKNIVETYDSILLQYREVAGELDRLEAQLKLVEDIKKKKDPSSEAGRLASDTDDLENFMHSLSSQLPDKHKRVAWRLEVVKLRKEEVRLRKLLNIARPFGTPEMPPREGDNTGQVESKTTLKRQTGNYFEKSSFNKGPSRVHDVFLEEDEEYKPKLPKVNCEDDSDLMKPVPYSKPQKALDKYRELLHRKNRKEELFPSFALDVSAVNIASGSTASSVCTVSEEIPQKHKGSSDIVVKDLMEAATVSERKEEPVSEPLEHITEQVVEQAIEFTRPSLIPPVKGKPKSLKTLTKSPFDFEADYEDWVPPKGQTGDGRTSLNEKYGY